MPLASHFTPLPSKEEPTPEAVAGAVSSCWDYGDEFDDDVVFAGQGDPLLRLDTLISSANLITNQNPGRRVKFRVNTNGLYENAGNIVLSLRDCGVSEVTVALNYDVSV